MGWRRDDTKWVEFKEESCLLINYSMWQSRNKWVVSCIWDGGDMKQNTLFICLGEGVTYYMPSFVPDLPFPGST